MLATALVAKHSQYLDMMDADKALAHSHNKTTKAVAKGADTRLPGEWESCEECSRAKAHRQTVKKKTDNRDTQQTGRVSMDMSVSMKECWSGFAQSSER